MDLQIQTSLYFVKLKNSDLISAPFYDLSTRWKDN